MRVVMFGLGQLSSLAWYCLTHDSPHEIVAFTVDGAYMDRAEFEGLPVVAFEDVENRFPPGDYAMLVPIGARAANGLRADKYGEARQKGYSFPSYVSSRALTWPDLVIGENSRPDDMIVNVTREKQKTNIRTHAADDAIKLAPPRIFTIETAIEHIADDELVEITPDAIRVRKRLLAEAERRRQGKRPREE